MLTTILQRYHTVFISKSVLRSYSHSRSQNLSPISFSFSSKSTTRTFSRYFSSSTATPTPPDVSFLMKYRNYFLLSSPLVALLFFNSGVLYYPSFRDLIEENVSRPYVQFLRDNIGFDDEDPVERRRIQMINDQIGRNVNIRLTFRDGTVTRYENVDGNQTLGNFLSSLTGVDKIDFEDEFANEPSTTPITVISPNLSSSYWEPYESPKPSVILNPYLVDLNEDYLLNQYNHIVSSFVRDVQQAGYIPQSRNHSSNQPTRTEATVTYDPKQAARETIAKLEKLIESYEAEMKYGTREIDSIQEDIKRVKEDINNIRRKHLNLFYYF